MVQTSFNIAYLKS